jgi:hypothetical protein
LSEREHETQLRICHQVLTGSRNLRAGYAKRFCDLEAYAWCFDCRYYVCDIHLASRHDLHDTQAEDA